MKKIRIISSLVLLLLIAPACQKFEDFSLSATIFIEDQYYPGLPIYSEWGYNTFGTYIDRKPFISTHEGLPVKVIVKSDTTNFILKGKFASGSVELQFSFKGFSPDTYQDLIDFDDKTINLRDENCSVSLKIGTEEHSLNIIEGEFKVKRVQRLYVDEEFNRTIISGYFNFKTFLYGEPIAISQGRYDLGIGYENFYNIK